MKGMKEFFANKPWKTWTTRKLSFIYSLILGTILIVVSYIALFRGLDPSSLLEVALSFPIWVVTGGAVVTVIKIIRNKDE